MVPADKADKLYKDYTCRGCGKPVVLCYGDINQTRHFRHKVQVWAPGEHCDYQDETYAHRQAKAILQQQRWVRVPPVMARRAEDYLGPVPTLREARTVEAVHVYNERTVYENAECGLDFQRQKEKFVPMKGQQDFVCRPDVIFTDADDKMLLLIEIHVTHEVDYKKLVGLRRAQVDTIEITIPYFLSAKEIEKLLASHANTKWLYNHERETTDPVGCDAAGPAPSGGDDTEEALEDEPESLDCQLHEIREAVRNLRKFMGGAAVGSLHQRLATARDELDEAEHGEAREDAAALARAEADLLAEFAEEEAEISRQKAALGAEKADVARVFESEQASLGRAIAAAEPDVRAACERAAPGLRQRVAERRATYRGTEHAVAASREQLRTQLDGEKADLDQRFQHAKEKLEREAAASTAYVDTATATEHATQDRLARLSSYLESRSSRAGDALQRRINEVVYEPSDTQWRRTQSRSLDEQETDAEREEASFDEQETDAEREEASFAAAETATQQRRAGHADRVAAREREAELIDTAQRRAEAGLAEEVAAATDYLARITPTYEALRAAKGRAIDRRFSQR
ncbi:hypothetical protein GCM10027422_34300 [Hymenobacter arcticus]